MEAVAGLLMSGFASERESPCGVEGDLDAFPLEMSKFCRKKCLFLICFLHQQYIQPGALFDPKWRYLLVKKALFLCAVRQGSTPTALQFSGCFFSGNIEVLPEKMSVSDMFSASTIPSTKCEKTCEKVTIFANKGQFSADFLG